MFILSSRSNLRLTGTVITRIGASRAPICEIAGRQPVIVEDARHYRDGVFPPQALNCGQSVRSATFCSKFVENLEQKVAERPDWPQFSA